TPGTPRVAQTCWPQTACGPDSRAASTKLRGVEAQLLEDVGLRLVEPDTEQVVALHRLPLQHAAVGDARFLLAGQVHVQGQAVRVRRLVDLRGLLDVVRRRFRAGSRCRGVFGGIVLPVQVRRGVVYGSARGVI